MHSVIRTLLLGVLSLSLLIGSNLNAVYSAESITWHDDYSSAVKAATNQKHKLLILFFDPTQKKIANQFEEEVLLAEEIHAQLSSFELVKLSIETEIDFEGEPSRLLEHESFSHLEQQHGLAILDFSNPDSDNYGYVVSLFQFIDGRFRSVKEMSVILKLPPGSLTQRTLIYAVRMHPDQPKSTNGQLSGLLVKATEKHSQLQADMRVQGHHHWDRRFQELLKKLPSDVVPTEVCAESWPGETLEEAAIECVRSWRHSSGHWSAVSDENVYYGYDLKRGSNGVWYGTGIFARKR